MRINMDSPKIFSIDIGSNAVALPILPATVGLTGVPLLYNVVTSEAESSFPRIDQGADLVTWGHRCSEDAGGAEEPPGEPPDLYFYGC